MRLNSAKDLDVYKRAYALAMEIFDISKKLEHSVPQGTPVTRRVSFGGGNPELASGKNLLSLIK